MRVVRTLCIGVMLLALATPALAGRGAQSRKRDGSCGGTPQAAVTQQKKQVRQGAVAPAAVRQAARDQLRKRDGSCQK